MRCMVETMETPTIYDKTLLSMDGRPPSMDGSIHEWDATSAKQQMLSH